MTRRTIVTVLICILLICVFSQGLLQIDSPLHKNYFIIKQDKTQLLKKNSWDFGRCIKKHFARKRSTNSNWKFVLLYVIIVVKTFLQDGKPVCGYNMVIQITIKVIR